MRLILQPKPHTSPQSFGFALGWTWDCSSRRNLYWRARTDCIMVCHDEISETFSAVPTDCRVPDLRAKKPLSLAKPPLGGVTLHIWKHVTPSSHRNTTNLSKSYTIALYICIPIRYICVIMFSWSLLAWQPKRNRVQNQKWILFSHKSHLKCLSH